MPQAKWQGAVLADSDATIIIEGSHYFPPDSLDQKYFLESPTHSTCPWKGEASYYTIKVDDQVNQDAAWFYPAPKEAAAEINGYVAFWKGVEIIE